MVISLKKRTLIIGSGPCAIHAAENLLVQGVETVVAVKETEHAIIKNLKSDKAEILLNVRVKGCKGFAGNFEVSMDVDGKKLLRSVSNIIIAEEGFRKSRVSEYNLIPTDSVIALSEFLKKSNSDASFANADQLVFVTGLYGGGNPVITSEIMQACLRLQTDLSIETYILTRDLKIGANGLEKLYRDTKKAGTVYVKFTEVLPDIIQGSDGKVCISFLDEVTGENLRLAPDVTIIDEDIFPSDYLNSLADIFGIDTDSAGFAQTDNVHRLSVFTNRKGIIVAGPSRGIQSPGEQWVDAENAVISTLQLFENGLDDVAKKAEINPGKCVRCLTCLRICPHRAISLKIRLSVETASCESCGICAAECPKGAININGFASYDILDDPDEYEVKGDHETFVPVLIAFCCSRSAARAWELAAHMALDLPQGLRVVEIPCGGIVSLDYVFAAFKSDADAVLVLTCHEGNCNSEQGNIYAKRRVDSIAGLLSQMGFEKDRLKVVSIASNMGKEFSDITRNFEKRIKELGPSRIKRA